MPYNSEITRVDSGALIPEDVSRDIINGLSADTGWLFRLARRLPDLSRKQRRMPVANALATAYFVDGDTGLKQTSELDWTNVYIDAEEVACIVPISEAVLDDVDYDIWAEVRPALIDAFNVAITQAVLYGTNIPATWTTNLGAHAGLVALATAHGTAISLASYTDLYEALLGETAAGADGLMMLLEAQGYVPNAMVAHASMKGKFRNCRAADGQRIFDANTSSVEGASVLFPTDGSVDSAQALVIAGVWPQLVYAMRQDMTYKILTEAVITDAGGLVVFNLAQQDMVALRAVMRLGFALPNPKTRMASGASRSPFAILTA